MRAAICFMFRRTEFCNALITLKDINIHKDRIKIFHIKDKEFDPPAGRVSMVFAIVTLNHVHFAPALSSKRDGTRVKLAPYGAGDLL